LAKKILLEIVTPERPVLKEEIDSLVLPGRDGQVGILPDHAPLLVQLTIGELKITADGQTKYFAVSGGFAEVHPNRVEVFAESAEMDSEIDVERARLAAERANKELEKSSNAGDLELARIALARALIRLRISEGLSKRRKK